MIRYFSITVYQMIYSYEIHHKPCPSLLNTVKQVPLLSYLFISLFHCALFTHPWKYTLEWYYVIGY